MAEARIFEEEGTTVPSSEGHEMLSGYKCSRNMHILLRWFV
jgi:hypothetical protein